ncbi:radical SAM protein [Planctomycetota bacterium]
MAQLDENKIATDLPVASLKYTHPLEQWLHRDWIRYILRKITADRPGTAPPYLFGALNCYGDPHLNLHDKLAYWPIHKIIDRLGGSINRRQLREKLAGDPPTLRGIIATARSIAQFGLTVPQRWLSPLFVDWNFTNRCNLHCRHCYQSSTVESADQELTLPEKLNLIDQFGRNYVAMVTFAGGEPTLSGDLEPCLVRCRKYDIHTRLASHGHLLGRERCQHLAESGLRYAEISLDSIDPEKHDRFRGVPGAWQRSVAGIKNVVATEGLRAGLAMCVTKENLHEVEPMLRFAYDLGVSCFVHFNFIPVGRGAGIIEKDISPAQREELLLLLQEWMNSRRLGVISTAPQFARLCMMHPDENSLFCYSHAGTAAGAWARVVARYLGGCGAGRTYACVQPNGDVTPCVYMPGRIMGNVREKSFTEIFQQSQWWDLFCDRNEREGNCGVCEYRNYCGGCRARADAYFNRLDQSDPGCVNNIQQWEKLTQQYLLAVTTIQTNDSSPSLLQHVKSI